MMASRIVIACSAALFAAVPALCQGSDSAGGGRSSSGSSRSAAAAPRGVAARPAAMNDRDVFMDAARTAWTYVDGQYNAQTGLVNSVAGYKYATVWDIGSGLLALFSANQLGLLPDADYDQRMRRALDMFVVEGIHTSIPLHQRILADADFVAANLSTHFMNHMKK